MLHLSKLHQTMMPTWKRSLKMQKMLNEIVVPFMQWVAFWNSSKKLMHLCSVITSRTNKRHIELSKQPYQDAPIRFAEIQWWIQEVRSIYEQFMASVDSNPNIPATQKFNYLKAPLTDEALQLVAHLPLSNSNYPIALKSLVDRYWLILNSHLDVFFSTWSRRKVILHQSYANCSSPLKKIWWQSRL